jgi:AraC-like DNA-binding protein
MGVTDYQTLIDPSKTYAGLHYSADVYANGDGVQYRSDPVQGSSSGRFFHEAVRISDQAVLLLTELMPSERGTYTQIVEGGDWLHIQFRFLGSGREEIGDRFSVETPERSCLVSRYPQGSIVNREIEKAKTWKYACLYLRPQTFTDILDIEAGALPDAARWMGHQHLTEFRCDKLPLTPLMMAPLSDIFSCEFRGPIRRAYMRAKSLEILATLVHTLDREANPHLNDQVKLSSSDLAKLAAARNIMNEDLENPVSLAALARRVGLNRTKLATGFKSTFGDSVHSHWRDIRLARAREMLQSGDVSVTEAALSVGYADISAFTRAFTNKFGNGPKSYKPGALARQ